MKSTAQRLAESYCKPKTEEEWVSLIGYVPAIGHTLCAWSDGFGAIEHENHLYWMTTEIPVSHFIDLLHDKIAPWRLAEDGFAYLTPMIEVATYPIGNVTVCFHEGKTSVILDPNDSPWHSHVCSGVKTYTDLITLMRLIG